MMIKMIGMINELIVNEEYLDNFMQILMRSDNRKFVHHRQKNAAHLLESTSKDERGDSHKLDQDINRWTASVF